MGLSAASAHNEFLQSWERLGAQHASRFVIVEKSY